MLTFVPGFHATGGPLSLSDSLVTKLGPVFLNCVAQSGFKIADVNGKGEFGKNIINL